MTLTCFSTIYKIFSGYISRKISKYFVEVYKDHYIIHYPYGVRWYKISVPKIIGPDKYITKVIADNEEITEKIKGLLGPSHNFHNQPISPESLGYNKMIFQFALEEDKIFEKDDTIIL